MYTHKMAWKSGEFRSIHISPLYAAYVRFDVTPRVDRIAAGQFHPHASPTSAGAAVLLAALAAASGR
jgi:hypothetical protein